MTAANWIAIAQIVLTAALAWIGWSVRSIKACITKDIQLVGVQVADLQRRMTAAEGKIETKVGDEEWLREVMRLRTQVDRMSDKLATLDGKLDSTLQVAMAVNRLADSVDRQTRGEDGER